MRLEMCERRRNASPDKVDFSKSEAPAGQVIRRTAGVALIVVDDTATAGRDACCYACTLGWGAAATPCNRSRYCDGDSPAIRRNTRLNCESDWNPTSYAASLTRTCEFISIAFT